MKRRAFLVPAAAGLLAGSGRIMTANQAAAPFRMHLAGLPLPELRKRYHPMRQLMLNLAALDRMPAAKAGASPAEADHRHGVARPPPDRSPETLS